MILLRPVEVFQRQKFHRQRLPEFGLHTGEFGLDAFDLISPFFTLLLVIPDLLLTFLLLGNGGLRILLGSLLLDDDLLKFLNELVTSCRSLFSL